MKELLQMALDALEVNYSDYIYDGAGPAIAGAFESDIAAIRSALAAPVAEVRAKSDAYGGTFVQWYSLPVAGMKLYAAPPAAPAPAVPATFVVPGFAQWRDGSAAPVVREPLTREQIAKALASAGLKPEDYRKDGLIEPLVWAIEQAHGIGGGGK